MEYFKPSSLQFAKVELVSAESTYLARTAAFMLDFLVKADRVSTAVEVHKAKAGFFDSFLLAHRQ